MAEKNVLIVVGTLRKNGFNEQLAQRIEALLAGRANVSRLDYAALPLMNQDLENPERPEVAAVREAVRQADGVWFVSPQYNASFPGHVKNLVDWLSRPLPGKGRDTAVAGGMRATVSGAGGRTATAEMRAALEAEKETGIALSGESWTTGTLSLSAEDEAALAAQADAFLEFIA